jgi:phage shock protein C
MATYRGFDRRGLYRNRREAWLAGVCAGLADRFDLPPWLVRLIFILLALTVVVLPLMVIVYIVLAFMMPPAPTWPPPGVAGADWDEFYAGSRAEALRRLSQRFETLDQRLRRMESIVTSPGYDIDDQLRRL